MISLSKIRNRAGLLVGIIAFALFAFVLGDLFRSGSSIFGENPKEMGEIAGRKVMIDEFEARLDKAIENEKQRQQKSSLDENAIDMLRQQTWNQLVYEVIMDGEYSTLGVGVSSEELFDMVQGKNPHPSVVQAFTDPKTGQFSPQSVVTFLKRMDEDQTGETKQRWLAFEKAMKTERIALKFTNMVKGGMFTTKAQAKRDYTDNNRNAKIKLLALRYNEIADSTVKFTDADLSNYYNQNSKKYKQNESVRGIEYVLFEAVPSPEDQQAIMSDVISMKTEFEATKDDSSYIGANSDSPLNIQYFKKGVLAGAMDSVMFNAPSGYVYGPYNEGKFVKLAKLIGTKYLPDSVKARHILIKADPSTMAKPKSKVDSLKKLIQSGMKFDQLAMMVSEDEGSKIKGGDLGWFQAGTMVKPFNDACFEGKKGDLPIVESQFGVHLIEILEKGKESPQVMVGVIDREMRASQKTFQKFYAQASEFAGKYNNVDAFDKAIMEQGLSKRIAEQLKENDRNLPGIQGARELIKWAYKSQLNDISSVFEFEGKYIVAKLSVVKNKGILPLEAVKNELTEAVKKEKKAELLIKKLQDASNGVAEIDAIAAKLNKKADTVDNANFGSGFIPNLGREQEVSGRLFTVSKGKNSEALKGENGVYMFSVLEVKEPAVKTDFKEQIGTLQAQFRNRADNEILEALKEKANIVDNRIKFF